MQKISKRQILKLSKRQYTDEEKDQLIDEMREKAKKDPVVIDLFKKYEVPIEKINNIDVSFGPLEVSAKTKDGKITINEKLIGAKDERDPIFYFFHELNHIVQRLTGKRVDNEGKDYIDDPNEEVAFKTQIDAIEEHLGEEKAEKYTSQLLDYHKVNDPKERKEKKHQLLCLK